MTHLRTWRLKNASRARYSVAAGLTMFLFVGGASAQSKESPLMVPVRVRDFIEWHECKPKSPSCFHTITVRRAVGQVVAFDARAAQFRVLAEGDTLYSGSVIFTGIGSYCEVKWQGATMRLWPRTCITIDPDRHELFLSQGGIVLACRRASPEFYAVRTAALNCTAGPGAIQVTALKNVAKYSYLSRPDWCKHCAQAFDIGTDLQKSAKPSKSMVRRL